MICTMCDTCGNAAKKLYKAAADIYYAEIAMIGGEAILELFPNNFGLLRELGSAVKGWEEIMDRDGD